MLTLTTDHRRTLKARAHALNPVVMIGKLGLSTSVIEELDRALTSHELIKVKVQTDDRMERNVLLEQICQHLNAAPVQHIGKVLVIFRPKPPESGQKPINEKQTRTSVKRKRSAVNTTSKSDKNRLVKPKRI